MTETMQTRTQPTFQLSLNVLLRRMLFNMDASGRLAALTEYFPFLAEYEQLLTIDGQERDIHEVGHPPLERLDAHAQLSSEDLLMLLAAGIVEEDLRFGSLFAALQEPLQSRRPCVGLLGWLLTPAGEPFDSWRTARHLIDLGLLEAENQQDVRLQWVLKVPSPLWDVIRGQPSPHPVAGLHWQSDFPELADLIFPEELYQQVQRLPVLLSDSQIDTLIIRGSTGTGRRTLIGTTAKAVGNGILLCNHLPKNNEETRIIGPLSAVLNAIPVLRATPNPGESAAIPKLLTYTGPIGITIGRTGGLSGESLIRALHMSLPPPDEAERRRFWRASGVPITPESLNLIASRFLLSGGLIHRAAPMAYTLMTLDEDTSITAGHVQRAARALNRQALETLATALPPLDGWDAVVVEPRLQHELMILEVRCREREHLRNAAGQAYQRTLNRGVRALFSGPSGTGKTLAARALAAALKMDIYRVDLASVVNKYIGETERNLNEVFSRAEELDVVLLLDEGDSLLARRTDVGSSNDRYANLETNYLLQRLETYEGIVIITTNAAHNIDDAFTRRLDVVVEFDAPEADERHRLWQHHLPGDHQINPDWLWTVARRCAVTGGQIRSAALYAILIALDEGQPLHDEHLTAALQREYRKAGAAYPLRQTHAGDLRK